MGKKKLSHDQKRKAKLAKRARHTLEPVSLAYAGKKYKTEELTDIFFRTELGIYESFILTRRELTDRMVASALTELVLQMRQGPLPSWEDVDSLEYVPGQEDDLIIFSIRRNWHDLFQTRPRPNSETLQGVLRTILHSIQVWASPSPQSRGYLHYLEGFLKKLGASVKVQPANREQLPPEPEDELVVIGRAWSRGDEQAAPEFRKLARHLIDSGQTERVVNASQSLIGELGQGPLMKELSAWSIEAQRAMKRDRGDSLPPASDSRPALPGPNA